MNKSAFDASIAEEFRPYLKLLANSHLRSWMKQRIDAFDVVQQTMVDAVTNQSSYRGSTRGEFLSWLKRILRNNVLDVKRHLGRQKRDVVREFPLDTSQSKSAYALASPNPSPSERCSTHEEVMRMALALQKLPLAQRDAVICHHLKGLSFAETASAIGRSPSAVGGLLFRGLRKLSALLDEDRE